MKLSADEIKSEAINIVRGEIDKYDEALFFVTENVAFSMRPLIRKLRKNYWGQFETNKKDKNTKKDNIWVPLTRLVVDTVRKNTDLDSKDAANIVARRGRRFGLVAMIRNFIRFWIEKTYFGEVLNRAILTLCIDGTVVWKTYMVRQNGKWVVKRKDVDVLNCYLDPTADSIQDVDFTERSLMTPEEIAGMDWMDNEGIKGSGSLHKTEKDILHSYETGRFQDVYEFWGSIPAYLITGVKYKKKTNEYVPGRIVVSGLQTGDIRVHVIEKNTQKDNDGNIVKPYEEAWYIKVPGRWYGVGPAEMVMQLQEWVNRVVNLRIKKNTNAALGLFKIKDNSGITQQQLSNLVSSGVIKLKSMDDLENLQIAEAGQASYTDEEVAKNWAFEVTSTLDVARGASLPASTSATATVIQDRNNKTAYVLVKESFGIFLERWFNRQYMPNLPKLMKQEPNIRIFGDYDDIKRVREEIASALVIKGIEKAKKAGKVPTEESVTAELQRVIERLERDGDLFFDLTEEIIANQYETRFIFTNEEMDTAVMVRNLIDIAGLLPPEAGQARNDFIAQTLDLLGIEPPKSLTQMQIPATTPQQAQQQLQNPTEQGMATEANTLTTPATI